MIKILVIDDDQSIRETLHNFFKREKYNSLTAKDGEEGLKLIESFSPDLVISDIKMPGISGLEVLSIAKEQYPDLCFIMITAHDDMQSTVEAMQKGAFDYIEKPLEIERLRHTIKKALENKSLNENLTVIVNEAAASYDMKNTLIGKSAAMKSIYKMIGQISNNRVTTLIQGESGTGKELVARAIHYSGITKNQPFIPVNCTALTETLLESELFGHVKGAFTGSTRDKKGKFELAGEGTLFLDEISEISPNLQIKLLRILQEKEFERVGDEKLLQMKARIIAATNKNLQKMVDDGNFREDLFFRLKVVSIDIPSIRERSEDIPLLVHHFLKKINNELHKNVLKITDEVMQLLKNHSWIGNVREIENTLMQAVVLSKGNVLKKDNIMLRKSNNYSSEFNNVTSMTLADVEKKHIQNMLDEMNWNKPKAAKSLGISLPTLYSKIENHKIVQSKSTND